MLFRYGFRYTEDSLEHLHVIQTIGREIAQDTSYCLEGLKRSETGLLFQYTVSGEGCLEIGNTVYRVPRQHGFFVNLPSAHRYYYDRDSELPWEFLWIKLNAVGSARYWQHFIQTFGHVAAIKHDAEPIKLLLNLLQDAADQKLSQSKYDISLRVYEWLLSMLRFSEGENRRDHAIPESVRLAKEFIDSQYSHPIALEQIANASRVSKHHLCKMFPRYIGTTPGDYLRKRRVEEAARLLRNTDMPLTQIAVRTGFDNISYFGKVFRKFAGITPTEYRHGQSDLSANYLYILN